MPVVSSVRVLSKRLFCYRPIADVDKRSAASYEPLVLLGKIIGGAEMIKKIASLLLGFSSVSLPVSAHMDKAPSSNSDRWMLYERVASDGKPLIVVARTGNAQVQTLLLKGRATVVVCRTDPTNVNDQGMPQGTNRLYSIEDKLDEELLAAGALRVASVTGQGQRRMFFVHHGPIDFLPVLQTNQVPGFICDASEVDDRQALIQFVTPTPLESQ